MGMMTSEHVVVNPESGRLLTDGTWTYKPPTAACIPQQMYISFLEVSIPSCVDWASLIDPTPWRMRSLKVWQIEYYQFVRPGLIRGLHLTTARQDGGTRVGKPDSQGTSHAAQYAILRSKYLASLSDLEENVQIVLNLQAKNMGNVPQAYQVTLI